MEDTTAQATTTLETLENDMHRRFDQVYLLLLDIQSELKSHRTRPQAAAESNPRWYEDPHGGQP